MVSLLLLHPAACCCSRAGGSLFGGGSHPRLIRFVAKVFVCLGWLFRIRFSCFFARSRVPGPGLCCRTRRACDHSRNRSGPLLGSLRGLTILNIIFHHADPLLCIPCGTPKTASFPPKTAQPFATGTNQRVFPTLSFVDLSGKAECFSLPRAVKHILGQLVVRTCRPDPVPQRLLAEPFITLHTRAECCCS